MGVEYLPLEPGALVYMFADMDEARPILNRMFTAYAPQPKAAEILDQTRYAVLAMFPPESGRNVQAVAWGKYPSAGAGFFFTFSKDWKKCKSITGKSYWYSDQDGLSVALNAGQAFVATGAAPCPPSLCRPLRKQAGPGKKGQPAPVPGWVKGF
ncbi:hypothetical protein AGMMS49579_07730 [Spirochaetia bacterium]|nr:hypothetical protein AGMMS49579_07730 [Spirochaetia bacterium]